MNLLGMKRKMLPYGNPQGPSGGGGGGGPTTSTVQNTNLPEYAQPYVETMLGTAQQQIYNRGPGKAATPDIQRQIGTDEGGQPIYETIKGTPATPGAVTGFKPYIPYGATVDAQGNITNTAQEQANAAVAGFSPMQQQAFKQAGQMQVPGQFGFGSDIAAQAGMGQLDTVRQASNYGRAGMGFGDQGSLYGRQGLEYGAAGANMSGMGFGAGQRFEQMATDPGAQQAFMSPYMQNVVDFQKQQAVRDYGIASQGRNAQAVRAGAFGGSRQAVAEGEANRALMNQLGGIQATGTQQAFQDAQKQMQFGADLGLRGLGAGYQGLGLGIQGAQAGMQGAGLGMQGAQTGLQGVGAQQAGFAGANQAAGTLGQLGSQQLAAQQGILDTQSRFGAQQQQLEQQKVNQAIQNYAMQQQYPMQQLAAMSSLLRGLPLQSATTQSYQAAPSAISQLGGLGLMGAAGYGMMKKEGGVIKSYAEGGAVESDGIARFSPGGDINRKVLLSPEKYSAETIDRSTKNGIIDDIVSLAVLKEKNEDAKTRQAQAASGQGKPPTIKDQLLAEAQQLRGIDTAPSNLPAEYAGGGIVAFSGEEGSQVEEPKGYFERMRERLGKARSSATTLPDAPKPFGIPLFGSAGAKVDPNTPIIEQGATPAAPTPAAKPDTGIRILPNEPRAKPSIMNPPAAAPAKAGMGEGGIDDLIRQSIGDIRSSGQASKDARKEAKLMAMMQAGLGIASGTSPFGLTNLKGAMPALQGYQEEMRGIRGDEAKQIAQIAALNLKGAELKNELNKLGITKERYDSQNKLDAARAEYFRSGKGTSTGLGGAVPPNVSRQVMGEYKGYLTNPKAAPFFSSLPKDVQTGLTKYKPGTESYNRSMEVFKQYANREMMNELNFYGSLNRRSPAAATSSLLED